VDRGREREREMSRKRGRRSQVVYSRGFFREMENATRFVLVMPVNQQRETKQHSLKNNCDCVIYGSMEGIIFVLRVRDCTADSHVITVLDVVPLAVVYPLSGHVSSPPGEFRILEEI